MWPLEGVNVIDHPKQGRAKKWVSSKLCAWMDTCDTATPPIVALCCSVISNPSIIPRDAIDKNPNFAFRLRQNQFSPSILVSKVWNDSKLLDYNIRIHLTIIHRYDCHHLKIPWQSARICWHLEDAIEMHSVMVGQEKQCCVWCYKMPSNECISDISQTQTRFTWHISRIKCSHLISRQKIFLVVQIRICAEINSLCH